MRRFIIASTFVFLVLLALDLYPGLRGGAGWRWAYDAATAIGPLLTLAAVLALGLSVGALLRLKATSTLWPHVLWSVASGVMIAYAAVGLRGDPAQTLFIRTVSPVQTGASTLAVRTIAQDGLHETLGRWPDVMRESLDLNLIHFTTSPPGQPVVHWAAAEVLGSLPTAGTLSRPLRGYQCSNPDVMAYQRGELLSVGLIGLLMPLWAALLTVPVAYSAYALTGERSAGQRAASWAVLIPSIVLFMPVWNVLYPALVALSLWLLVIGLRRDNLAYHVGAGAVMSISTFLNFAVLPVLGILGLFTLAWHAFRRETSDHWRWMIAAIRVGLAFGVGLLLCWLPFWLATGYSPLDIWAVTQEKHSALVAARREYWPWLLLHPYDTLLFLGWPLVGWAGWTLWRRVRAGQRDAIVLLGGATLLTMLLLNISGLVQGENGRILSFYAPFVLIVAAAGPARPSDRPQGPLLLAQAVMLAVMAYALAVVPLDLERPPDGPRDDIATLEAITAWPVGAIFSSERYPGQVELLSHRYVADVAAQTITLQTTWRGIQPTERPYQIEVVAVAENDIDGQIVVPPQRWFPQGGAYLSTCWQADDTVHDLHILSLPIISAPVIWTLELRLVDPRTGDVMHAASADHVPLGPVRYP